MRTRIQAELAIIRQNRTLLDRVIIRLFRRTIKRFVTAHLNRAHEVSEINNNTLHSIDGHIGADLELPGYKK